MSSAQNSQNLLTNVFRPTYVYSNGSGFTTGVVATNLKSLDVPTVRTNILDIGDAGSNVYLGTNAGVPYSTNTTNLNVSAFGVNAAAGISNVSNSVFIGTAAGLGLSNATDTTVIGANDAVIGTRNVVIGNRDFIFGSNNIVIGSDVSINESYKLNIANLIIGDIGSDVCGAALIFNSDVRINGIFTSELFDASGLSTTNIAVPGYIRNDPTFGIVMDISGGNFAFTGTGPSRVAGIVFSNGRIDASQGIYGIGYDLSTGLVLSGDISANGALRLPGLVFSNGDLVASRVRDLGLTFDISGGNIKNTSNTTSSNFTTSTASSNSIGGVVLSNNAISNSSSTTSSNFITLSASSNSIGGVVLSNNAISNTGTTTSSNFITLSASSNYIGGVILNNTDISNLGTTTSSNFFTTFATSSNSIGGVTLSNTNISNTGSTNSSNFIGTATASNSIGGVTLSNTSITYAGNITGTTDSASNKIGGVTLSNNTISNSGSTSNSIGGVTLSNTSITYAGNITGTTDSASNKIGGVTLSNSNALVGSGSVSIPSYSFVTDPSAGIYRTGTNQIGFTVGGSNRVNISNSNVGIGTTTPTTALVVVGDISASGFIRTGAGTVSAPSHSFVADPSAGIYRTGTNQIGFTVGGINRVNISNGNVGIGTTAPTSVLDLSGGGINLWGLSNNSTARPALTTTPDNIAPAYEIRSRTVNGGDGFLRIRSGQAANTASYIDLTGFSFCNDMNYNIVFGTSSAERVRIDAAGNVGIGTNTPVYALDICGTIRALEGLKQGTNTWGAYSDQRIKQNIQLADISTCYSIVKNLPLKRFTWDASYVPNLKDRNVVGWIAQDVERVFKRAVQTTTDFGFEDLRVLDVDQIYKTMYGALEKVIADKETLETRTATLEQQLSNVLTRLSNAGV